MTDAGPFHAGELAAQARMGHDDIAGWARRAIRPFMPDQHRRFFADQPFLAAAARDGEGRPWATLLAGGQGSIASPDATTLAIDAKPVKGDALEGAFRAGAKVGLLGLEFATRRRNRVNGRIAAAAAGGLQFKVDQSFGNCPQHIRERLLRRVEAEPGPARRSETLSDGQRHMIEAADTFFIASGHPGEAAAAEGLDVSHRGGPAGFVRAPGGDLIVFPDYGGNRFMNTVGNLLLDNRVGLLFVDFATGGMVQVAGRAEVIWDGPDLAASPGAERLIRIAVEAVVDLPGALPLRWETTADAKFDLRISDKVREAPDVISLHLEPAGDWTAPSFKPGQYLPIAFDVPGVEAPVERTYSISGRTPSGGYRITVKRRPGGLVSNLVHESLEVGDDLRVGLPSGEFTAPPGDRPLALVSAGAGATPMAAVLQDLAAKRRLVWLHAARDADHALFGQEVAAAGIEARDFYSQGERLDASAVLDAVGSIDADIMLCGADAFVAEMTASLIDLGVDPDRIVSEGFG